MKFSGHGDATDLGKYNSTYVYILSTQLDYCIPVLVIKLMIKGAYPRATPVLGSLKVVVRVLWSTK